MESLGSVAAKGNRTMNDVNLESFQMDWYARNPSSLECLVMVALQVFVVAFLVLVVGDSLLQYWRQR